MPALGLFIHDVDYWAYDSKKIYDNEKSSTNFVNFKRSQLLRVWKRIRGIYRLSEIVITSLVSLRCDLIKYLNEAWRKRTMRIPARSTGRRHQSKSVSIHVVLKLWQFTSNCLTCCVIFHHLWETFKPTSSQPDGNNSSQYAFIISCFNS